LRLPPYPRYKPSGVEWLGNLPEHWRTLRLKWIGESIIGLTYSPADVVSENEGTLVLRSSNIQDGRIVLDDNVFVSAQIPPKLLTHENDILICSRNGSRALVGKSAKISLPESNVSFGAFTTVFRSRYNDYTFYVFQSDLFSCQAGLYQTSTINQLTIGTLNSFQVPFPPFSEQQAIVKFLDRETERIDRLVKRKRELIERLKERRTALISRTVTGGLSPADARIAGLPENLIFKPSGLDWLGDIPAHWKPTPLKHIVVTPITDGPHTTPEFVPMGIPFVSAEAVWGGRIHLDAIRGFISSEDHAEYSQKYSPQKNDIYVVKSGSTTGKVAINHLLEDFSIWSPLAAIRCDEQTALPAFIFFALSSDYFQGLVRVSWSFGTQPNIGMEVLENLIVILPPLAEQAAIAEYLNKETARLDGLVTNVEAAIERLQEYRTALITAAVTGKIDVRKAVA
jgi:type I restriction enzyme, S subunit